MAERLDGLDRLVRPVQLFHHDRHVLQRAVDSVPRIYSGPEQGDGLTRILVYQLKSRTENRFDHNPLKDNLTHHTRSLSAFTLEEGQPQCTISSS